MAGGLLWGSGQGHKRRAGLRAIGPWVVGWLGAALGMHKGPEAKSL